MDKVSESPFISLQPSQFTPHTTVIHFRPEKPAEPSTSSRVRRFHHKTRTGCRECKQKRRKCNEEKPSCQGCLKSKIECHYEDFIPPRVQPKNRKRPQRKPAPNRFVFIEFGEASVATSSRQEVNVPDDSDSSTSIVEITRWQSAPSTCLLQGGLAGVDTTGSIGKEVEFIQLFRSYTYRTLPLNYYDCEAWAKVTFESCYSQTYLYNVTIALAASHQRTLQGGLTRTAQEISHYVKALAGFRSAVSNPGILSSMDKHTWTTTVTTAALLSMYIMSCPADNYETSCDTYFSLTRGTMNMLSEAMKKGHMHFTRSELNQSAVAVGERHDRPIPDFPGLRYAASGDDKAISEGVAQRLSSVLAAISVEDKFTTNAKVMANLQKVALEWPAMSDASLLQMFRAKSRKAYIVTAHFYAGIWRIKEIIESLCKRGLWDEATGTVDSYWWLVAPKGICKRSLEMLEGEPKERIAWAESVVRELEPTR